jgi:hypothetical protein
MPEKFLFYMRFSTYLVLRAVGAGEFCPIIEVFIIIHLHSIVAILYFADIFE